MSFGVSAWRSITQSSSWRARAAAMSKLIVAPPSRYGAALQLARLRLARGSRPSAPPLAGSWGDDLQRRLDAIEGRHDVRAGDSVADGAERLAGDAHALGARRGPGA